LNWDAALTILSHTLSWEFFEELHQKNQVRNSNKKTGDREAWWCMLIITFQKEL
jgi:hypothetical protein